MQFFAVGQEAHGVIAIGQMATGVIAIGQVATGVIAIGQVARGVVAVGMLAFGLVSLGMVSVGLIFAAGILGAGGRAGPGGIIPLVPTPRRKPQLPTRSTLEAIQSTRREGWLDVIVRLDGSGAITLLHRGSPLPANLARKLATAASVYARLQGHAVAYVVPNEEGLRVTRLMMNPKPTYRRFVGTVFQLGLLLSSAYCYWYFVLVDVGDHVIAIGREVIGSIR
jgi:hypothetical protein